MSEITVINMGIPGPPGPQGPAGGGGAGSTLTLQAGESLTVGDPVRISNNTFLKADNVTNFKVVGVVTTAVQTGFSATVALSGPITLSGLTPNAVYFLGSGIITVVAPSAGCVVRLGQAISTTSLLLNIEEPILLN